MIFYDITHTLGSGTAAWPGDEPFRLETICSLSAGDPVNLSRLSTSPHTGTHADAPYHYDSQGLTMDRVPPERYIGPARLVALEGHAIIRAADLESLTLTGVERLLIRTGTCHDPAGFNPGFTALEAAAVAYLAGIGVRLIGTDAYSVDPFDSTDLAAHRACAAADILILENLKLTHVPPGDYELIALPLKLAGGDGSPVRAVLRTLPGGGV